MIIIMIPLQVLILQPSVDLQKEQQDFSSIPEDKMLVISTFEQTAINDENESVSCEGWTFCSKSEMRNINAIFISQKSLGLSVNADATHKLLFNGWVMPTLIGETVKYCVDNSRHSYHSPVSLIHACCRSEAQPVYDAMLQSLSIIGKYFGHGVENIKRGSAASDHSWSILNANKDTKGVHSVDCCIHVERGMKNTHHCLQTKNTTRIFKLISKT